MNRYNLPLDHKYRLVGTEEGYMEDGGESCQNCNRAICNIAIVKTEEEKIYRIGMDCAETLSYCDYSDKWKVMEANKKIARHKKYNRMFKKWLTDNQLTVTISKNEVIIYNKAGITKFESSWKVRMGLSTWTANFQTKLFLPVTVTL